jgi:RNA polymerase sigma factor (sigma-70 family)
MAKRIRGILESLLGRCQDAALCEVVSDSELLQRFIATRDEAAFELLMWRHGAMVLGVCRRAIRDLQLAEDAFQAVFLVLARKAGTIRCGNVAGWLFRVARRVAARAIRQRSLSQLPSDLPSHPQPSLVEQEEVTEILDAEIALLPDRLRRVVILCYLGGQTTEEAARELSCPRGTILSRLAAARKCLARRLSRRGVILPAAIVVSGTEPTSRLVSATISDMPRLLSGMARPGSMATILAHGVIQTMTRGTLVTAFACALVAAAFAGGVGWVAAQAQTTRPGITALQPLASQPAAGARAPSTPVARADDKPRDQQLRKLEQLQAELSDKGQILEQRIAQLREKTRNESLGAAVRLRTAQSAYDIDRELAVGELREAATQTRTARRSLADTESMLQKDVTNAAREIGRKRLELAEKELSRRREELRNLNGQHLPAIEQLRESVTRAETQYINQISSLEEELTVVRESRASLTRQIMAIQSGLPDAASQPAINPDVGSKLDALLREVGQLRKEVRELKK